MSYFDAYESLVLMPFGDEDGYVVVVCIYGRAGACVCVSE